MSHPKIVKYIGCQYGENFINIYLEYMSGQTVYLIYIIKGGSIANRLKQYGKFPETIIKKFVAQVLQGLTYLHNIGVVHRDLKVKNTTPSHLKYFQGGNILSDEKGNVKLADFGASRIIEIIPHQNLVESDMCSSLKGSLYWMAPEILLQQLHGRRIDVWSLGCTIIEMATATHPWYFCFCV